MDTLTQEEANRVLGSVSKEDKELKPIEVSKIGAFSSYDFSKPPSLSRTFYANLATVIDGASKAMAISLSTYFRSMVAVSPVGVEHKIFQNFIGEVTNPSCIAIVNLPPLAGKGILEIDSRVIFAFVDKLMGGAGESIKKVREFTEIEIHVASQILEKLLADFSAGCARFVDLSPVISRMESNPEFVNICGSNDRAVILTFEIGVGEFVGLMNISILLSSFEPVRSKFDPVEELDFGKSLNKKDAGQLRRTVGELKLDMRVKIGEVKLPLIRARTMKKGDSIILDKKASEPVDIYIEGKKRFNGMPGQINGKKAVRLISAIKEGGNHGTK